MLWGGAILAFLAGVRRGLSFRSPKGETLPQMASMLYLFGLALLGLGAGVSKTALAPLILGFVSVAVLDTLAARREEVPPFFARLRPTQMIVVVASLASVLPKA